MKKYRVLHVVTYMGRGGLETMLMNYHRNIDRTKVQFDFLVHRSERWDYDDEIESLGGKIYRISKLNPFSVKYRMEIKQFLKLHSEYQIIHVHQDCMSSIILKQAARQGVKVRIAHCHSTSQDKNIKYFLKMYYKQQIPKYATHLLACGQSAGEWMFGKEQFDILNNAIDAKQYSYSNKIDTRIRKEFQILDNQIVIGHVGRFSDVKNHEFLLDVFKRVSEKTDAILLLVGDGKLRTEIENKIQQLSLGNKVILTGVRADVHHLLQVMDVFVFPSKYEGFPVTIIEAQAAGVPCLISDKVPIDCKITDLVEQIGLSNNIEDWVNCVIEMASREKKNTLENIVIEGFDLEKNAIKLVDFYIDEVKKDERIK